MQITPLLIILTVLQQSSLCNTITRHWLQGLEKVCSHYGWVIYLLDYLYYTTVIHFIPWIWILIVTTNKTNLKLNTAKLDFTLLLASSGLVRCIRNVTLRTTWRTNNYGSDLCIRDYHVYEEI